MRRRPRPQLPVGRSRITFTSGPPDLERRARRRVRSGSCIDRSGSGPPRTRERVRTRADAPRGSLPSAEAPPVAHSPRGHRRRLVLEPAEAFVPRVLQLDHRQLVGQAVLRVHVSPTRPLGRPTARVIGGSEPGVTEQPPAAAGRHATSAARPPPSTSDRVAPAARSSPRRRAAPGVRDGLAALTAARVGTRSFGTGPARVRGTRRHPASPVSGAES